MSKTIMLLVVLAAMLLFSVMTTAQVFCPVMYNASGLTNGMWTWASNDELAMGQGMLAGAP